MNSCSSCWWLWYICTKETHQSPISVARTQQALKHLLNLFKIYSHTGWDTIHKTNRFRCVHLKCCSYIQTAQYCILLMFLMFHVVLVFDWNNAGAHRLLEAHSRNVAPHSCVLLVAAAEGLLVEEALRDGLLKSRALHFIHMHRAHTWKAHTKDTDTEGKN